jgi:hypothetical protein
MTQKFHAEPLVYRSLGLEALYQRLQGISACSILDLGPVRNQSIEFWSQFKPFIYVADLRSQLPLPIVKNEGSEAAEPDWNFLLALPAGRRYNVMLAWDLLNYLDLPSVFSLVRYLKHFSLHGTALFTLIFDQKQMPEQITIYRIVDEAHLAYEYESSEARTCPRHQPHALAGVMQPFKISNSFRLRNQIVEFLFLYEGEEEFAAKGESSHVQ